jgi:hypothetical protein
MGSGHPDTPEFFNIDPHVVVQRFLKMVARPDLHSEFPEQFEKHWENKGILGKVQIIRCRIADHPCELVFSLFFNEYDEVVQTGIVIKFEQETLLNEVQKGDALDFHATRRIDPIAFLKTNYPVAGAVASTASKSYTLAVDDNSEEELWRAVRQLTGKSDFEIREIWQELLNGNSKRLGKDQISPIINTWLKKERDRIDLQYLRFAQLLQPRAGNSVTFTAPNHTCVVACKHFPGTYIRGFVDAVDPEWWGGRFYRLNQGALECVAHEQQDRILALKSFDNAMEFPVEEIYIDNRHIYSVIFVGDEALVWRTKNQIVTSVPGAMPTVATPSGKGEGLLSRLKRKAASSAAPAAEPPADDLDRPGPPAAHPYHLARAEKAYMAALAAKTPNLKEARQNYLKLLFESDPRRFRASREDFLAEIQGAISTALKRNPAAVQKEFALIEAHATILYDEME